MTVSLESIINELDFLKSSYSIQHQKKDLQLCATKLTEEISDPGNAKEHYQSFIRKKNTKSVKQSNAQHSKVLGNRKIADANPVITKHVKTSHKLCRIIRQAENVSQEGY